MLMNIIKVSQCNGVILRSADRRGVSPSVGAGTYRWTRFGVCEFVIIAQYNGFVLGKNVWAQRRGFFGETVSVSRLL